MKLWRELNPTLRGFAIILLISGVITAASGEKALFALFVLMRIAFLLAMIWFGYTLWRNHRTEIAVWPLRARIVFYGAAGLLVVDLLVFFFLHVSGPDALAFFLVLAGGGYAMWRVWREQHTYS